MEKILTNDGSETYFNTEYQETYHSKTGAIEEAIKKFVMPCKINELAKSGHVKILDVCYGLGYNSCAAIDKIKEINPYCNIEIIGLEKDRQLKELVIGLRPDLKNYDVIQKSYIDGEYKNNFISIKLIFQDAREAIKTLSDSFDAIFLDPFSPKKNSELWTEEFFKELFRVLKHRKILATYSCARIVRENMKKAGFIVQDGPKVRRRGPSTIALKS